jgi:hypothetical protein
VIEHAGSFKAFGEAGVEELLGERLPDCRFLEAATLDSMVLLNRGDRFEARALPVEAQFAPAFGVTVADFDGDGAEDLFLAQNCFGVEPETARFDAGRGLLLRGDGQGGWAAMSGADSGIAIYGEQRASAAADFDGDGRTDLVVSQHGDETKLYRNRRARPGLRVRLNGPPGNPAGIGAQLRLLVAAGPGAAREIHGGTGWLSSDSSVVVLAAPASEARLWVRWPGGRITETAIPPGAREVSVTAAQPD